MEGEPKAFKSIKSSREEWRSMKLCKLLTHGVWLSPLLLAAGCGIQGKWSLESVEPTAAQRDFEWQVLTLQKDGSFYGEKQNAGIHTASGTYRFDRNKHVLTLKEHNGSTYVYNDVQLIDGGNGMRMERAWKDQVIVAKFEKRTSEQ
jgi:hypothetical protein